jgi:hypothetical protein
VTRSRLLSVTLDRLALWIPGPATTPAEFDARRLKLAAGFLKLKLENQDAALFPGNDVPVWPMGRVEGFVPWRFLLSPIECDAWEWTGPDIVDGILIPGQGDAVVKWRRA